MTAASGTRSTLLCSPQEAAPICSGQCAFSQMHWWFSNCTISMYHINPKSHAVAFHTKMFSFLPWQLPGRHSIVTIYLQSSGSKGLMKASLTNILPLLHQIYRIQPPHHLPQGTLLKLVFSTPPIRQKTMPWSGIRDWRLIMTWNYPPKMFLWLTILLLTHCLRDRHGGRLALISGLW